MRFLAPAASIPVTSTAAAEVPTSRRIDGYELHYNALRTSFLDAAMARRYGIQRSSRGGMLIISVQRIGDDGSTHALAATISGEAVNLLGRRTPITFREIPGDYISYVGLFELAGPDTWTFELSITPTGASRPMALRFSQDFTAD
ncbi:MAG TPA: DUF4426 domain-containing protein [Dokdonella sp.]|uniref:DUF4426 domain-containing protein n=1 Tax=Dokdonella sp. TaxID=2291710 RepID=UPI0025C50BDB|nr:DUF4426 domain-containing protein [Dokdonella sp.]MBX3690882.1 DUF4426 domain-containing protein [Dokdonella sp.]HNR91398.1 DUF4426 domain-containing protein [Dokdonella sp.]